MAATGESEHARAPLQAAPGSPLAEPLAGARPRWRAAPYSYGRAHALAEELGLSVTTAAILVRRGLADGRSARRFLDAAESHDPLQFRGMAEAVESIRGHLERGSAIAVHGDYDVDGVCSTALLVRALRALGGEVLPWLPDRMGDGYGLSARTIDSIRALGAELLLTVDCGIGAVEEVAYARRIGLDVVVTDHHRPGDELPACPVVHPAVCDYPCPELCATGVAYKLCQALYAAAGRGPAELEGELDLVALATVADLVPLVGENRALVRRGLQALAGTAKPGLRALMTVAGVEPQTVGERALGFALAPRINAAGRIDRADAALELLLTEDDGRALQIARELDSLNSERQGIETRILFEAERLLSEGGHKDEPVYVLGAREWHPGVVGIVASRIVERYGRPCVLVALDGSGRGRGSGRSIGAYDLHAGLAACTRQLARFGGHRMAAGVELEEANLGPFRDALVAHAREALRDEDFVPLDHVDAVVPGDAVGLGLADELELLRPFGMGNPAVRLLVPAARIADVRAMGEGRHARFTVKSAGVRANAVAFGAGTGLASSNGNGSREAPAPECPHDLIAGLEANEWRGAVEPRLVLRSLHPIEPVAEDGCAGCSCRARGEDWWDAAWLELERDLDGWGGRPRDGADPVAARSGRSRKLVDDRESGILGTLSDLLSTDESVLVVCADSSRRRGLLSRELHPARFGRPPAAIVSARCRPETIAAAGAALPERALALVDYATIEQRPALPVGFNHVFALDPPPFGWLAELLQNAGPPEPAAAFCHLGWGAAEVDFTRRSLEHQYGLRAPLAALYRALSRHPEGLEGEALETALSGDGRHPRSPAAAGRCLRVLLELGLVDLSRSSATVKCTIIRQEKVDLERSEAFRAYTRLYEEGLRFLSASAQPRSRQRAA